MTTMTPDDRPAPQRNGHKTTRVSHGLVALGSASVFAVYALGFARTKAASERFAEDAAPRRRPVPVPSEAAAATMSLPPLAETTPTADAVRAPLAAPVSEPVASRPVALAASVRQEQQEAPAAPTVRNAAVSGPTVSIAPSTSAPEPAPAAAVAAISPVPVETPSVPLAVATATPAPAALAASAVTPAAAPGKVVMKDGTYTGWGTCRHGDIQATVVIASGRILSATISQCWTRYPCSWISPLPPQVAQRQSAEVDYVSGATQSTNAFYDAVMDALAKAK